LDVEANGKGGTAGARIGIEAFGPSFTKEGDDIPINGFAGIGTNLFEDIPNTTPTYYNAVEAGITGFYFEYCTSGDITSFKVEVEDKASAATDNGEVFYLFVQGTTGSCNEASSWRSGVISFDKLVLPDWASERDAATQPLDLTKLAKFQFKVEGPANNSGGLRIDNVYLLGNAASSVKLAGSKVRAANALRASYSRGGIGVNWNAPASIASGKVQLVNTKGRVVATAPISKTSGSKISMNIGAGKIPTGMYFVRVDARDVNGRKVVQQTSVNVVK
jgi:hypothetical protein